MIHSFTVADALMHHQAGDLSAAQSMYESLVQRNPFDANVLHLLGVLHNARGDLVTGIGFIERALMLVPSMPEAHYNLGNALARVSRHGEAISSYTRALACKPDHADAALNQGDCYRQLRRYADAERSYRQALELRPANRHLLVRLGVVLRAQRRLADAAEIYQQVLAMDPTDVDANTNFGNLLNEVGEHERALAHYVAATLGPNPNYSAIGMAVSCAMHINDWSNPHWSRVSEPGFKDSLVAPFIFLALSKSHADQLHVARRYARAHRVNVRADSLNVEPKQGGRLRVGYLSSDYHEHATSYLIAELFEKHDRRGFEIIGISAGPQSDSPIRRRLLAAFDDFLDVSDMDDVTAARRIAELGIDILVDLKGHTKDAREGIMGYRAAPVQVNYLGYPGTMGADSIDYILADSVVLPFSEQPFYTEKIVHLQHCYQANDSMVEVSANVPTRDANGIPENAFVFCCFNATYKITEIMFACWMRILAAVPGSVLWLFESNDSAARNLRVEAEKHGIDSARLIFAPSRPHAIHLARYRLADLFLDTAPYNAHTTASDALRSGLPIITIRGHTFAGRVAGSLLTAVGVPELIADNAEQYVAMAVALANDAAELQKLRSKVAFGVLHGPLFNTELFARGVEAAYIEMHRRAVTGEAPTSFSVAELLSSAAPRGFVGLDGGKSSLLADL